jgi:hypothetical protein
MLLSIAGFILLNIALAGLFILAGLSVYGLLGPGVRHPLSLKVGIGFFSGLSLFVLCYRTVASHDARLGLIITLAGMLLLAVLVVVSMKDGVRDALHAMWERRTAILLTAAITPLFVLAMWLEPRPSMVLHPSDPLATLHSGRYANVVLYILRENYMPVLGQNYLQSLLASTVPMVTGWHWPLFALYLWLSISVAMLTIMFYGTLRLFDFSHTRAYVGAAVLMLGNTALSLTHVVVIDSGSPFFYNGYTDTLVSAGTFFVFLFYLRRIYFNGVTPADCIVPLVLGVTWNMYAPQNSLLAIGLLFLTGLIAWRASRDYRKYLMALAVLCLAVWIGSFQGGFLAPKKLLEETPIPGALKLAAGNKEYHIHAGLTGFRPTSHLPRTKWTPIAWHRYPLIQETAGNQPLRRKVLARLSALYAAAYTFGSNLLAAFGLMFFPVLGMSLMGWLAARKKPARPDVSPAADPMHLFAVSLAVFAGGFVVSFFLDIRNAYKWELSRFMTPGIALSMLLLVISLYWIKDRFLKRSRGKYAWLPAAVFALTLFGPVTNIVFMSIVNVSAINGPAYLSFTERLNLLFSTQSMIQYVDRPPDP